MSSHEASTHHHEEPRSKSSMSASFWFVIILVGLFIAALNFISVMGHDAGGEGHGGHATEQTTTAPEGHHDGTNSESAHEPTENISNHGEASSATADTAHAAEAGAHH